MAKKSQKIKVKVGNVTIGDSNHYVIQSMTNTKTTNIAKTVNQINDLIDAGCELVRVAVNDQKDIQALKQIINQVKIPIVADTHYDYQLAIDAIKAGASKIRINPGNLVGGINSFKKVIDIAKKYRAAIRIGINVGSINKKIKTNQQIINLMKDYIKVCTQLHFNQIVLSIKSTDISQTIKLNELLAKEFNYPIHIGLTEAGDIYSSAIKSTIALVPLIKKEIGNTIRISITGNPIDEVKIAKKILHFCNIKQNITEIISCPTCSRTSNNFYWFIKQITPFIDLNPNNKIKVAIMGCYINGINEAKHVNLGIYCINNKFVLIKNKKTIGTFNKSQIINQFKSAYLSFK